jgi:predicted dithiol-disulfide oxidoreductase (DUF899 family)
MQFPNEPKEYRKARNNLLELEIRARRALEDAARARRNLPLGGKVPADFIFHECDEKGRTRAVTLSELFTPPLPTLVVYSYMYGAKRQEPCPMCTGILDSLNGVLSHITRRAAFVVVAQSPAQKLSDWVHERHWDLRLVSASENKYNSLYNPPSDEDGNFPTINVFTKKSDGIYHTYAMEMSAADADPGQDFRGLDLLSPIFHFFDLTPEGRGMFYTSLHYPKALSAPDKTVEGKEIPQSVRPE